MSAPFTLAALRVRRERILATGELFAEGRALAAALAAIDWPAEDDERECLGVDLGTIVDACLYGHRDLAALQRDVAGYLQWAMHQGGAETVPRSVFEERAAVLVRAYIAGE